MLRRNRPQAGSMYGSCRNEVLDVRWEYYCTPCREYGWYGSKTRGYMNSTINPQLLRFELNLLDDIFDVFLRQQFLSFTIISSLKN